MGVTTGAISLQEQPGISIRHEGALRIAQDLRALLADVFVLYLKTKNFHWHVGGPLFPVYHALLEEQALQIFAMTDPSRSGCERSDSERCGRSGHRTVPTAEGQRSASITGTRDVE